MLQAIQKYFTLAIGWTVIYFSPTFPFVLIVGFFVIVDTITGVFAAAERGEAITSKRFRQVFPKYIVYALAVLVAHVIQKQFFPDFVAMKLIAGLVAYNELMSIDENIKDITGFSLFKSVIKKFKRQ